MANITFVEEAALGISIGIRGKLLDRAGFVPNASRSLTTLVGMRALLTIVPIVVPLVSAAAITFYVVGARLFGHLVRVLRRRYPGEMPT